MHVTPTIGFGHLQNYKVRQLTSRCAFPTSGRFVANTNNYTQVQSITYFYLLKDCRNIAFTLGNYYVSSAGSTDMTGQYNVTYRLGLWDGTNVFPIYWPGGSRDGTIAPGQIKKTAPLVYTGKAGQKLWLVKFATWASPPTSFPAAQTVSNQSSYNNNEWGNALTDRTLDPTSFTAARPLGSYDICPVLAITGKSAPGSIAVAILGDSIACDGSTDTALTAGHVGWALRGLGYSNIPNISLGQSSLRLEDVMGTAAGTARAQRLSALLPAGITHVLCPLATNDWSSGLTAAHIYANFQALQTVLAGINGIKLIPATAPPKTNAANSGMNGSETQTFTQRALLNGMIASNNGVGYGYYDLAAVTQDSTNNNLWRTDLYRGTSTTSISVASGGAHYAMGDFIALSGGGMAQVNGVNGSGAVTSVSFNGATDTGGYNTATPGVQTSLQCFRIAVTPSTVLGSGATFNITSTTAVGIPTGDGIHPGDPLHALIAADFRAKIAAGLFK